MKAYELVFLLGRNIIEQTGISKFEVGWDAVREGISNLRCLQKK
jgi:hypothetical protein